jgi:hypothetical protein
VPDSFSRAGLSTLLTAPRCPRVYERHSRWRTVAEWRRLGIVPLGRRTLPDTELATLAGAGRPGKTAYLLTWQLPAPSRLQLLQFLRALSSACSPTRLQR